MFDTPHGVLCLGHTREKMKADDDLWMPQRLPRGTTDAPGTAGRC